MFPPLLAVDGFIVRAVKRDLGCDVGNQLEVLGKTTCTEKSIKIFEKLAERRSSAPNVC
jgi:hypothetical protein